MKEIHKKIWDLAIEYQDFRDDKGHAEITLRSAQKLLNTEDANPDIVIPAITLHDIGWSQLPKKERFLIFRLDVDQEEKIKMRFRHQEEGCKLAETILEKVGYDKKLSEQIIEIISQHDTRIGSFSKEDSITRDADKLWRFSKEGFWADIKRMKISAQELRDRLSNNIDKEGFFFTESAKNIAREELKQRKGEF